MAADDRELITRSRTGDLAAFEGLVRAHQSHIYNLTYRLTGNHEDASDAAQDAFVRAFQALSRFRQEAAFSTWLYRIATNAAYGRLRARRSRAEVALDPLLPVFDDEWHHTEPVSDWSTQPDDPAAAADTRSALEQAIQELPADHRRVLLLRDVEELSNEETAEAVGATVGAVKSRLQGLSRRRVRLPDAREDARNRPALPPEAPTE